MNPRDSYVTGPERMAMINRLCEMGLDEADAQLYYPTTHEVRSESERKAVTDERLRSKAPTPTAPQDYTEVASSNWKTQYRARSRRNIRPGSLQPQWGSDFNAGPGSDPLMTKGGVVSWSENWFATYVP